MRRLAVALALGALLVACGGDANDADLQPEIVDQWADAFLDGDPDAVAALFTEDGTYEERGPSQVFEG
ncbi:MAG: hypothetical protein GY720_07305, partial [bacterium]|nr:hypothetical protein [bacterium]